MCLRLIVVNPVYDMRTVGFESIEELKSFGMQNAVRHWSACFPEDADMMYFCLRSPTLQSQQDTPRVEPVAPTDVKGAQPKRSNFFYYRAPICVRPKVSMLCILLVPLQHRLPIRCENRRKGQ